MANPSKLYRFRDFELHSSRRRLYWQGDPRRLTAKEFSLLHLLLERHAETVSHKEISETVWKQPRTAANAIQGVVSSLRRKLGDDSKDPHIIQTASGEGYVFVEDVSVADVAEDLESDKIKGAQEGISRGKTGILIAAVLVAGIAILGWYLWPSDDDAIKRVLLESQRYESLVLYANPRSINDDMLRRYWVDDPLAPDLDIHKIRTGVQNLIDHGIHYGQESRLAKFEASVVVGDQKDRAIAKTIEQWSIVKYCDDGTLIPSKPFPEDSVTYWLRKVDGNWLIEKSTTPRAKPSRWCIENGHFSP